MFDFITLDKIAVSNVPAYFLVDLSNLLDIFCFHICHSFFRLLMHILLYMVRKVWVLGAVIMKPHYTD